MSSLPPTAAPSLYYYYEFFTLIPPRQFWVLPLDIYAPSIYDAPHSVRSIGWLVGCGSGVSFVVWVIFASTGQTSQEVGVSAVGWIGHCTVIHHLSYLRTVVSLVGCVGRLWRAWVWDGLGMDRMDGQELARGENAVLIRSFRGSYLWCLLWTM